MRTAHWLARCTTILTLALMLTACNTGGGGGGGGDVDPYPDTQFGGGDAELDANLTAISDATEQALLCGGRESRPEEAAILDVVKRRYAEDETVAPTLEDYVALTAQGDQARADEICDTTLENASDGLLALVVRMTEAVNDCLGEQDQVTDEDSLEVLKSKWLDPAPLDYPTLTDFAAAFVPEVEQAECEP